MTVLWNWVGAAGPGGATVVGKVSSSANVRLAVATNSSLSSPTYFGPVTPGPGNLVRITATGLAADTQHWWALEHNGVLDTAFQGKFRTHPAVGTPYSFTFAAAGDAGGAGGNPPTVPGVGGEVCSGAFSNHQVFDTIRTADPLFFIHLGDLHYMNFTGGNVCGPAPDATVGNYRRAYDDVLNQPRQHNLYRSLPVAHTWDDHEYGPNDSDRTYSGKEVAAQVYRECEPHYPIAATGNAIYHSFQVGRVLFVMTDSRYNRDPISAPNDAAKTLLGTAQKDWLAGLLNTSTAEALVLAVSVPWLTALNQYSSERAELAALFKSTGWARRMCVISADAHVLAIATGAANQHGGFPVYQFAPLDTSLGDTSVTVYDLGIEAQVGSYGLVDVADTGDQIRITGAGHRHGVGQRFAHTFVVKPGADMVDEFTRPNNADLGANWRHASSSLKIAANRATPTVDVTTCLAVTADPASSDDMYAQAKLTNPVGGAFQGVVARGPNLTGESTAAAGAYYVAQISGATLDTISIRRKTAGVSGLTVLASATLPAPATSGQTLRLEARGDTLTASLDGVQRVQVVDTAVAGQRRGGLYTSGTGSAGITFDDFEMGPLVAGVGQTADADTAFARAAGGIGPTLRFAQDIDLGEPPPATATDGHPAEATFGVPLDPPAWHPPAGVTYWTGTDWAPSLGVEGDPAGAGLVPGEVLAWSQLSSDPGAGEGPPPEPLAVDAAPDTPAAAAAGHTATTPLVALRATATSTGQPAAEVTIPAQVQPGDGMLLVHGQTNTVNDPADPPGWARLLQQDVAANGRITVWARAAQPGDPGTVVQATPSHPKYTMALLAYRGADPTGPVAATAGLAETIARAAHPLPSVTNPASGTLLVSVLQDRGTSTAGTGSTVLTPPTGAAQRVELHHPAGDTFRLGLGVADEPAPAGTAGGGTYTSDYSTSAAVMACLLLAPAP